MKGICRRCSVTFELSRQMAMLSLLYNNFWKLTGKCSSPWSEKMSAWGAAQMTRWRWTPKWWQLCNPMKLVFTLCLFQKARNPMMQKNQNQANQALGIRGEANLIPVTITRATTTKVKAKESRRASVQLTSCHVPCRTRDVLGWMITTGGCVSTLTWTSAKMPPMEQNVAVDGVYVWRRVLCSSQCFWPQ